MENNNLILKKIYLDNKIISSLIENKDDLQELNVNLFSLSKKNKHYVPFYIKKENLNKQKIDLSEIFYIDSNNILKEYKNGFVEVENDCQLNLKEILGYEILDYKVETVDYSKIENKDFNINLFVGGTGSGKTYKAINENENFIIAVPTRQLAYEIAIDYAEKISYIATGEVHITDTTKNAVVVYENLNEEFLRKYDTLIVDEAHFINENERGVYLLQNIIKAIEMDKKVVLLTATDTLSNELKEKLNINTIELKPYKKVEKIELDSIEDIKKIAKENGTILVFTKYKPTEEDVENYADMFEIDLNKADFISADVPTSERIRKQIAFKKGDIQLMVSSNVLAQGVNFPADVVVIEFNEWDSPEIIEQKIGRSGRPQYKDKGYYYLHYRPPLQRKEKLIRSAPVNNVIFYRGIYVKDLKLRDFEIPDNLNNYSGFKYSKKLLEYLETQDLINPKEKEALDFLRNEETKVKQILQEYNVQKPAQNLDVPKEPSISAQIRFKK